MFVTTYSNRDVGDTHAFVRLNSSHNGAWEDALKDTQEALNEYNVENDFEGTQVIDCIEGEGNDPSIIRIINPDTGYEYEAYIIEEHIVNA